MADAERPVSRLPALTDSPANPALSELADRARAQGRHLLNIHRVVGHAPKLARAQATYAAAMRDQASIPRDFQELVILRIAQINNSQYEQSVHRSVAISCGVPAAKIAALAAWRDSALFTPRERTALTYADQAAASGEVNDTVFAEVRAEFTAQEIVELTALVAWYTGNSRFVRALRIEPETE